MRDNSRRDYRDNSELQNHQVELHDLRARKRAAQSVLQQLQDGIDHFKRQCDRPLSSKLEQLEVLETEISRIIGSRPPCQTCFSDVSPRSTSIPATIKSLYRMVAKAIHPDVAASLAPNMDRHELMAQANRAYAADDSATLREILGKWRQGAGGAGEGDGDDVLGRLIEKEKHDLEVLDAAVDALRRSCAWRLKLRHDRSCGTESAADMVAIADMSIAGAARRLAELRGVRTLRFPEVSCGTLYVRDRCSVNYTHWERVGEAKGDIEVEADRAVRLDLQGESRGIASLQNLLKDDLQSLFLYSAADDDVAAISHLTGLQELYLSGARLTDAALATVSTLKNLGRIYIYHTTISDAGLMELRNLPALHGLTCCENAITGSGVAGLRAVLPDLEIVTFQWRR